MKVAVSSISNNIDSKVSAVFGRCPYFLIVEIKDNQIKDIISIENTAAAQSGGAGIKAAQTVAEQKVKAVITGNLGPNASNVLKQFKIKAYCASGVIKQAVDDFIKGNLEEITKIVKPHFAMKQQETKTEKIFIPLMDNNSEDSEISPHFGHAPFFGLYDAKSKEFTITENKIDHSDPTKTPVDQIIEAVNPTTIFAQGIGERAISLFKEKGIILKTGPYKTVKEVIQNIDKLQDLTEGCGH